MARKHIEPLVKPHTGPVNPCGFSLMWWDFDHERIRVEPWSARPAVTGAHATSDLSHVTRHNNSMAAEPLIETAGSAPILEG